MTTRSIRVSARHHRFLVSVSALLAFAALTACGTGLAPTAAPIVVEASGRAVEVVETGAGDATVVFESGPGSDWSPCARSRAKWPSRRMCGWRQLLLAISDD